MRNFFLVILAYLPFQLALNVSSEIDLASGRIFILLLFLVFLFNALKNKRFSFSFSLVDFLFLGFLFFMTFSILQSEELNWSLRKILFLLSLSPIYFLARSFIQDKKYLFRVLCWVVASSSLVAILGIGQFFAQFIFGIDEVYKFFSTKILPVFSGNSFAEAVLANPAWLVNISGKTLLRATSLFPDPHMFSFYLNLSLGLNMAILIGSKKKKALWMATFLLILTASLLTFSRGGYLGLLIAGLLVSIFHFLRSRFLYKICLSSFILMGLFFLIIPSPISDRLSSSFDVREGSNIERIETWRKSVDVLEDNILFGVGIGNYPLYIKANADYREPIYAHSNYLDIALDGGLLSLFFWISLIISSCFSYFFLSKKDPLFLAILFSLLSFSIHSFFETSIYSISVFPLFLVIISLASFKLRKDEKTI